MYGPYCTELTLGRIFKSGFLKLYRDSCTILLRALFRHTILLIVHYNLSAIKVLIDVLFITLSDQLNVQNSLIYLKDNAFSQMPLRNSSCLT